MLALAAVLMFEARARATEAVERVGALVLHRRAAWPLRLTLDATPSMSRTSPPPGTIAMRSRSATIAPSTLPIVERRHGSVRFTAMGLQQTGALCLQR